MLLPMAKTGRKSMTKRANPDHPIHELIANRWSPYGFSDKMVSQSDLCSLFEAARWAPSSYNEQPWRYIVATRDDSQGYQKLLGCLVEPNQAWAQNASALVLCVASTKFVRNGKPNRAAEHDIGLASANLSLEATARGISVHQMIGILPDKARTTFSIPEDYVPLTAIAIGYAADPGALDDATKERDAATRQRRPLAELLFSENWGRPAKLG
jgi:nitroreductase